MLFRSCLAWCLWYLEHRILNHNIDPKVLIDKTLKKLFKQKLKFSEFIRNYGNNINKERYKIMKKIGIPEKRISDEKISLKYEQLFSEKPMGKKLTYWERASRDAAKSRQRREAAASRKAEREQRMRERERERAQKKRERDAERAQRAREKQAERESAKQAKLDEIN